MDEQKKPQVNEAGARQQARQDIAADPDLAEPSPTDNLDEGELARKDNSNEKAFDSLERPADEFVKE